MDNVTSSLSHGSETNTSQHSHEDYTLYQVFLLPPANEIAQPSGKLLIAPEQFLLKCLIHAKQRNQINLRDGHHHSKDYFTDLNHAERHRIPYTLQRLNSKIESERYGIMSFTVYKDEQVKNKVFNQRIASVNPMVITAERVRDIYYPENYQTEKTVDLHILGQVTTINQEHFSIVHIDEAMIKKLTNV